LETSVPAEDGVAEGSEICMTPTATESDSNPPRSPLCCIADNSCCALTPFVVVVDEAVDDEGESNEVSRADGLKELTPVTEEPIKCSFRTPYRLEFPLRHGKKVPFFR
jgi:hypothetical protein